MKLLSRKISDFCRLRISSVLPPHEAERIRQYMLDLIAQRRQPPRLSLRSRNRCIGPRTESYRAGLDAIARALKDAAKPALRAPRLRLPDPPGEARSHRGKRSSGERSIGQPSELPKESASQKANRQKPGMKPRAIEEFPTALFDQWIDPPTFQEALKLHMREVIRHSAEPIRRPTPRDHSPYCSPR
ncbi:hypothetical protein [Mesorhizobium sp. B1-1-8]|uniref:hypothetical protein n=1 Tax=Mesorhizobium sp. B1-1-8 TaxID=2589976 RepID=UPI0011290BBB|nr:hypothetical protein [Mesorhizobium sp. B1-1-8]UCI09556.1 hypothetical protein FJ974_11100 [Mesorhizobium sp. B1-1-8]